MTQIKGILFPAAEECPVQLFDIEQGDYEAIQYHVGGVFDLVRLQTPEATFFVHDEGKILRYPLNRRASLVTWASNPNFRHQDVLVGDCFLMGPADEEGETMGAPDELIQLYFNTVRFKYEVLMQGSNEWELSRQTYPDAWTALNYGISLTDRVEVASTVRLVRA